ncbi:hypothetical protein N7478_011087 [Penicillium angulare]|uniref:uncharacterized protein n=1 Tax=Penicillium angulare TaxID=116970 RepID=UPI0025424F75|nr:uncharacterized protein N7478_011087 [Penicillium angulare]KAJ5263482.1 hypothetical protein N7478_011087 [Penicillium angulare]
MAQKISESLVTITQVPSPSEIMGEQRVDRTMIKGFWQGTQNKNHDELLSQASNKEMDRRLEYLFWRIWSSDDLLERTNIKYLDGLVSRIMASEPLPLSPPNKPDTLGSPSSKATSPRAVPTSDSQKYMESKSVPPNCTPGSGGLHPILKKPNTAPTPQKTTRLLLEHPSGENITTSPSNPPTPSVIEIAPKDDFSTTRQPAKKATHFTTGRATRGGKRRPVFNRRKSSQSSISKPASAVSPRDRPIETPPRDSPEPMFDVDEDDDLSAPLDPQTVAESKSHQASAATSWSDLTITSTTPIMLSKKLSSKTPPQLAPTLLDIDIPDKQDPILPQGIETVSLDLNMQEIRNPNAETQDHSSYETVVNLNVDTGDLPGARRIPNPEERRRPRSKTIPAKVSEKHPSYAHVRPRTSDHTWHPPPRENFLINQMMLNKRPNPQPLNEPLVSKDFRAQWLKVLEEAGMLEAAGKRYDIHSEGGEGYSFPEQFSDPPQFDEDQIVGIRIRGIGTDGSSSSRCQSAVFDGSD